MSIWFTEELHPYYRKGVRVKRILADEQTQYQHLQFVETEFFGNAMILDGIIQLTERDNMGYHEMIVHVPMLAVGRAEACADRRRRRWRFTAAGVAISICGGSCRL